MSPLNNEIIGSKPRQSCSRTGSQDHYTSCQGTSWGGLHSPNALAEWKNIRKMGPRPMLESLIHSVKSRRIVSPKDSHILIAETCEYVITWQRDFADVIKAKDLEMGSLS